MAGKRQHFVPRFLQRAFASHSDSDKFYTWVYRKNAEPHNTNTINSGVEGFFYSEKDEPYLDKVITDIEPQFSGVVDNLLNGIVSESEIPQLITHCETRTRNLRINFTNSAQYIVDAIVDFVADEKQFIPYLERKFREDPSILNEAIKKQLKGTSLANIDMQATIMSMMPRLLDQVIRPRLGDLSRSMRKSLPTVVREGAKKAHNNTLAKALMPDIRLKKHSEFNYKIVKYESNNVILGDSIVIFDTSCGYRQFTSEGMDVYSVVLPLSPSLILFGNKDPDQLPPSIDILRQKIARCSAEFFISHSDNELNRDLSREIGLETELISIEELEDILNGLGVFRQVIG